MRRRSVGWLAAALLVGAGTAHAAPRPSDPATTRPTDPSEAFMLKHNLYPAAAKFGRGVTNVLTGWLEIPIHMQKYYVPNDTGTSLFTGASIGFIKGVIRTAVGAYETASFFLPYPEDFAPILPPLEQVRFYTPPETPASAASSSASP